MVWLARQMDIQALHGVSRISVVGPSGSGKSRLSRELHDRLRLPLHELDAIRFDRSGKAQEPDAFVASVADVVERESWIVDGHYRATRTMVWNRSQLVIWLNYSLPLVFWRLLRRGVRKKLGRARGEPGWPGSPTGSGAGQRQVVASWRTRFDRVTKTIRERKEYRTMLGALAASGVQVLELRSVSQADELYRRLRPATADKSDRAGAVSLELFGLPGAGKTTLTKAIEPVAGLRTRHELAGEWKRQPLGRRAIVVARTFTDLPLMLAAVRLVAGTRLYRLESVSRLVRLLLMKHWIRTRSGIMLFDQGMMQKLWSALYASDRCDPDPRHTAPLLRSLYHGTKTQLILLEIAEIDAARRVAQRTYGRSRFDGLSEPDLDTLMKRAALLVAALAETARKSGLPVERLNGSAPIAQLTTSLEAIVGQHAESLRP